MSGTKHSNDYVLGSSDFEHDRLVRQAQMLDPYTRRAFVDAGLAPGQRVLDVGSGMGDVAMLAASIVGPTGTVIGVDRAQDSLTKARERARIRRLANVSFLATDLTDPRIEGTFDAIVGRFILMFLADPVETLKQLATRLRPGGTMVFHEPSWASFFPLAAHLPLYTRCGELLCETLRRTGARPDMPAILHKGFLTAGLTEPQLRVEVALATRQEEQRWLADLLMTMQPRIAELRIPLDGLGDLDTIGTRLESEFAASASYVPLLGLVAGSARKPQEDMGHTMR